MLTDDDVVVISEVVASVTDGADAGAGEDTLDVNTFVSRKDPDHSSLSQSSAAGKLSSQVPQVAKKNNYNYNNEHLPSWQA